MLSIQKPPLHGGSYNGETQPVARAEPKEHHTTIDIPQPPRGNWDGSDFGQSDQKASKTPDLAERKLRTTYFQIQQRHYKRDLTGLEALHFQELTDRLVLRKSSVLDPLTAKALKSHPELSGALLDHAADIAHQLAAAGITPQELTLALATIETQDSLLRAFSGATGSVGFNAAGATIGAYANRTSKLFHDEHADLKTAASIIGPYALILPLADYLAGKAGEGVLRYTKPVGGLDDVPQALQPLVDALTPDKVGQVAIPTSVVTAAYGSKNLPRGVLEMRIAASERAGRLTPLQAGVTKDMVDFGLGTVAGAATANIMPAATRGDGHQLQDVLMDRNIGKTIVDTVERFVRPKGIEYMTNLTRHGFDQAAKMTAGLLAGLAEQFVPFEGVAKALAGREVEPGVPYILPKILRELLTLKGFVNCLTINGYTAALVFSSAVIDRMAKEKNWSPEYTEGVRTAVRMAIPAVAYMVMVSFAGIAKLGDQAMGKLAHQVADPYLQRLKDWWNPQHAIEPAPTEPAATQPVTSTQTV